MLCQVLRKFRVRVGLLHGSWYQLKIVISIILNLLLCI